MSNKKLIIGLIAVITLAGAGASAWYFGFFGGDSKLTLESNQISELNVKKAADKYAEINKDNAEKLDDKSFRLFTICHYLISKNMNEKTIKKIFDEEKPASAETTTSETPANSTDNTANTTETKEETKSDKAIKANKKLTEEFFGKADKFEPFIKDDKLYKFTVKENKVVPTEEQLATIEKHKAAITEVETAASKSVSDDLKKELVEMNLVLGEKKCSYFGLAFTNWVEYVSTA